MKRKKRRRTVDENLHKPATNGARFRGGRSQFHLLHYASGVIQSKGHTPVSPFEVSPDHDATYAEHIGTDITALLVCEAVLFLPGWQKSKGCRLEYEAAVIYGKEMYFDLDEIKNI